MSEVFGIDVSHYQGKINWKQVADSGKKFAILKCMYEAQSHRKDETFENNYRESDIYGMSRGVYIFVGSHSIQDTTGDARALLGHLNNRPLEYGIWLDYESDKLRDQSSNKIREMTQIYSQAFRSAGYYVGIYCNQDWYDHVIPQDLKSEYDFWIARYPKSDLGKYYPTSKSKPNYKQAVAWQYSSKGSVPGINGNVDLDVDFDGCVNLIAKTPYKKSNEEIAQEVWQGLWGTERSKPTRRELLTRAGYDYAAIRKIVNATKPC